MNLSPLNSKRVGNFANFVLSKKVIFLIVTVLPVKCIETRTFDFHFQTMLTEICCRAICFGTVALIIYHLLTKQNNIDKNKEMADEQLHVKVNFIAHRPTNFQWKRLRYKSLIA